MSGQITCNDRTRTYWTPTMERFFIDLMLEHLHRGNRTGHTFNKQAWNEMLSVFNSKFGSQYDKDVLKSRYTNLWKQYNDVKCLLDHGGFVWDQTHQTVIGDESLWSLYLKAHPEARVYKTKPVLNFSDLCLIYGYTVADGRYSMSSHDLEVEDEINGESSGSVVISGKESSKTEWTTEMDQYFIEIMVDQIGRGNKTGNAFSKQAWTDMLVLFNARFSGQYGKRVLRHRYNKLLKYYKDMEAILKEDGFSWDETQLMIAADDAFWDSYIKDHPLARTYRMKSLPSYNDLDTIFACPAEQGTMPHPVQGKDHRDDGSAAQTSETKANQVHNSDRTRTFWTPPMDYYLIELLVDQVNNGNRVGQTFITSAWNEMVTAFNTKFGSQHNKDVLKNRYKHLRRLYNDIKFLLEQNGFSWDTRRDMVLADDDTWNTYIQAHPEARSYRVKTIPSYPNLCFIFGKETSDGRYTRLAQAFDPIPAETVQMIESGSTDVFKDTLGETHGIQMVVYTSNEKNDYTCSNIGPPCIEWTRVMDRCLIDLMLEQVNRGNKIGETFTEQAWADMAESFNAKFGLETDMFMLENRYILMMKERDDINNILNLDGFTWDEEKQTIVAEDEYWEAYIKEHPDATIYKGKTLDSYGNLCKLNDHLSQESFNCENLMIELENYGNEMEIVDDLSSLHKQQNKRTNPITPPLGLVVCKAQKTGVEMRKSLCETDGDNDCTKPMPPNEMYSRIGSALDALQALPDMDDELLLDACDLLEDERKAKIFLALDVSLRRKWLVRKLRPSANF
ncbi:L10-interacting MYB domain-containing protein isoform X1 [Arabidopsis lyrata subsp. lyrata]|uniref:L10-interacting MYB domain-containing protein isoform X1 n=1 Tax=Arabidopsis lyrata subsp. lyrata TaxID=81972 RepID=UPI000A29B165|nr:L10-interacting MYB domain-containing protein isoform X1 [Arabidopsis lyrata subsp. lyrata]|eukprot:XP_020885417.1 L10-interacting MYB domain-containing protein isoform X1 [Arabidopsis lyrata subsp. lyrata]